MESVDQVGRRERFMQSNFESLSGGDDTSLPASMSNSISNAWREGGAAAGTSTSAHQRNAETIDTARRLRDAEQNRRREELQRRIEETRMKLQNIGYRTLKGSQSINDLSSFPESSPSSSGTLPRPSRADDDKKAKREPESSPNTSVEEAKTEVEGGSSGSQGTALKRAYSLSDLNKPNVPRRILPAPPANVSGKKGAGPLMSLTPTRPASSQSSDNERIRQRRKSIDDRSDRGSEYGGSRKGSSKSPGPVLSRLEQHERMLAERE